ncbi:hypothetical protein [Streptomyces sp. NPDC059816]|uniref:hypothetical protein n=1 Tax=Streptomyces sp. NPDC059816 TaxID=3346960 RepID=UPI003669D145
MENGDLRARLARTGALFTTALTLVSLLVLAGPAVTSTEAASSCAGRVVRTLQLGAGEVVVHKNSRWVCAVTTAHRRGDLRHMTVGVQARGSREVVKRGWFRKRSVPVTVYAGQRCVRVAGSISGQHRRSAWILC